MVPGKMVRERNGPRKIQKRKIVGWASSIVVCVCGMLGCDQSIKTQNSKTKNRGMSVEHRGVCVEYSDVINL